MHSQKQTDDKLKENLNKKNTGQEWLLHSLSMETTKWGIIFREKKVLIPPRSSEIVLEALLYVGFSCNLSPTSLWTEPGLHTVGLLMASKLLNIIIWVISHAQDFVQCINKIWTVKRIVRLSLFIMLNLQHWDLLLWSKSVMVSELYYYLKNQPGSFSLDQSVVIVAIVNVSQQ